MSRRFHRRVPTVLVSVLLLLLAACGGGEGESGEDTAGGASPEATGGDGGGEAAGGVGPIDIWYSNNPEEIEWGEAVVEAWNSENSDQQVTAQEIPAGESSEEVIRAAITAGNAPCLIYNTAPAAVPSFNRAGGLVALDQFDGARELIEERLGDVASQYQSEDGQFHQFPWKANPVMILYNKDLFEEAGLDPENPPLSTHDEFLETSRTLVEQGVAEAAIYPAPTSQFFQSWFDFYPWFAAETGGQQLVEDGEPQFNSEAGLAVANTWKTLYDEGLAPREEYQGDAFADGVSAMSSAGPWAVAIYGDVNWGVVPPPTSQGTGSEEVYTFSDGKSVGLYTACENQQTAWDFLAFSMSEENDQALLETTGQMPMRQDLLDAFPDFFEQNAQYEIFAQQVDRVVEVPYLPSSIEMWQTFRDAWSSSVIFGEQEVEPAMEDAANAVADLVQG
ncbi:MAG TPA: extracellular solute-binding protein [Euzebyales bacterium]